MPWTPPSRGFAGTVITEAWSVANVVTLLNWLRLMTGNADPPGSGYVVVGDTVGSTTWKTGLAGVTDILGDSPANRTGDTFTGPATVPWYLTLNALDAIGNGGRIVVKGSGGFSDAVIDNTTGALRIHRGAAPVLGFDLSGGGLNVPGPVAAAALSSTASGRFVGERPSGAAGYTIDAASNIFRIYNTLDTSKTLGFGLTSGTLSVPGSATLDALGPATSGRVVAQPAASSAGYTIDADSSVFRIYNTANAAWMLAFSLTGGVLAVNGSTVITAATIGSQSVATAGNATQVGGRTPSTAPAPSGIPVADGAGKIDAGWLPAASGGDAPSVTGHVPTATPAPGALPLADASGTLNPWVTGTGGGGGDTFPIGLICLWNAGAPPPGWTFETRFDGRFPLGAGGALGLTLASPPGGAATYDHSINIAHGHNDTISVGGTVGADASSPVKATVVTPGDANAALSGHGHTFTGSKGGSVTALANPTNLGTGAIGHLPPYATTNYIRKL